MACSEQSLYGSKQMVVYGSIRALMMKGPDKKGPYNRAMIKSPHFLLYVSSIFQSNLAQSLPSYSQTLILIFWFQFVQRDLACCLQF